MMAEQGGLAAGARAGAVAAVRALGGARVWVRMWLPPVAGSTGEELGLAAPEFRDVVLAPCVVRHGADGGCDVLVAAPVAEQALGVSDAVAVQAALRAAALVRVGAEGMIPVSVGERAVHGSACLYRLRLRRASAEVSR